MTDFEFNDNVSVAFKNIVDGFNSFPNITLDFKALNFNEDKIIDLIKNIYDENDGECFIDFYISKLSQEDKNNIINLAGDKDKELLKSIIENNTHTGVYYKLLSKDLIPLLTRLNTREIFFVTFYFTKKPITIWGNYNMKFPCFFENDEDMKFYSNLFYYTA
ncbi:hypothetical protein [Clostridium paraputrificum]|uniref:hypothetical protein n=1 Tax=Clostridium paraputrificum TaxID=29363 RepID=UPI003D34DEFE